MTDTAGSKHYTPGPWRPSPMKSGMDIWIGTDNVNVALVPGYTDHPNNAANARLIAAAPLLLEALNGLLAHTLSNQSPEGQRAVMAARAAIAKAEGR